MADETTSAEPEAPGAGRRGAGGDRQADRGAGAARRHRAAARPGRPRRRRRRARRPGRPAAATGATATSQSDHVENVDRHQPRGQGGEGRPAVLVQRPGGGGRRQGQGRHRHRQGQRGVARRSARRSTRPSARMVELPRDRLDHPARGRGPARRRAGAAQARRHRDRRHRRRPGARGARVRRHHRHPDQEPGLDQPAQHGARHDGRAEPAGVARARWRASAASSSTRSPTSRGRRAEHGPQSGRRPSGPRRITRPTIPAEQDAATPRGQADPLGDRASGDHAPHARARWASGTTSRRCSVKNTASVRGMLYKVRHLVEVTPAEEK